jgi:hypothetical protein
MKLRERGANQFSKSTSTMTLAITLPSDSDEGCVAKLLRRFVESFLKRLNIQVIEKIAVFTLVFLQPVILRLRAAVAGALQKFSSS